MRCPPAFGAPSQTTSISDLLQQHYGTPTRLLDWTSDALGALSFSVADKRFWEVDGSVLMLDAYQFCGFNGIASSRRTGLRSSVGRIANWSDKQEFHSLTFPVRPDRLDVRMNLQRSGFTFHVPARLELGATMDKSLRVISVAADAKEQIGRRIQPAVLNCHVPSTASIPQRRYNSNPTQTRGASIERVTDDELLVLARQGSLASGLS